MSQEINCGVLQVRLSPYPLPFLCVGPQLRSGWRQPGRGDEAETVFPGVTLVLQLEESWQILGSTVPGVDSTPWQGCEAPGQPIYCRGAIGVLYPSLIEKPSPEEQE